MRLEKEKDYEKDYCDRYKKLVKIIAIFIYILSFALNLTDAFLYVSRRDISSLFISPLKFSLLIINLGR